MLNTIKPITRVNQVREQLEQAIARGDLQPGDRLPPERSLAETLGVSRVSVREALGALATLGLIESRQGQGRFVARPPADGFVGPFIARLAQHRDDVLNLLAVRAALNGLAAEAAARRRQPEAIDRIRAAHEAFGAAADRNDDLETLMRLDTAFHEAIGAASDNPLLVDLMCNINPFLHEVRGVTLFQIGRASRSLREHAAIHDAIAAGHGARARAAAIRHNETVSALVVKLLSRSAEA